MEEIKIPKAWLVRLVQLGNKIDMNEEYENICHLKGYIESAEAFIGKEIEQKI